MKPTRAMAESWIEGFIAAMVECGMTEPEVLWAISQVLSRKAEAKEHEQHLPDGRADARS